MVMLASDVANPDFVGAQNPDDLLHVEFYMYAPLDKYKSEEQGKQVRFPEEPYVRIMRPGDNTSIIETAVRQEHKQRWPKKWLFFQMQRGEVPMDNIPGWKIEDWEVLTDDQRHELKFLRFSTVEQIAGASDSQIQRLGIGGNGLREQAKNAIKTKQRSEAQAEIEARDKEIADLKGSLAEIKAMLAAQKPPIQDEHVGAEASPIQVVIEQPSQQPKKRRGRPPKVKA